MTTTGSQSQRFEPAECFKGVKPYASETRAPWVDLALDANEATGMPVESLDEIAAMSTDEFRRYPSDAGLVQALANRFGIHPNRVLVTCGGDEAIDRVCKVALTPGRRLVTHTPIFEMITRSARLAGGAIEAVAWSRGDFPIDNLLDRIKPGTGLVAIVSPNNPTGLAVEIDAIRSVADAAERVGALVLVDLAYIEFADTDPVDELISLGNVVVVRTFSKAFGLAGLRVGYAIALESVASLLRAAGGPYPVSSPSLRIAERVLTDRKIQIHVQDMIASVREQRETLSDLLTELGCEVEKSQANFVLARTSKAQFLWAGLRSLGIAVRRYEGNPDLDDVVRITLPGETTGFARLTAAIEAILSPDAILFDLDGVLADVGSSYREAIKRTAQDFNVNLTLDEIQQAKEAGNANNDWVVTQSLLAAHDVQVPLEVVTDQFQAHYLGKAGKPGLREHERLIPSPSFLRTLGERYRLAVVTGRPRAEADWFLDRFNIKYLIEVCVCMEDAPAKPSPEPVQIAVQRLGLSSAWMIGDTPDDVVAARGAGVLPIGINAPDQGSGGRFLANWGAAFALESLDELMEILP